jgi:DnaJ-class molecular chaperone
MTTDTKDDLPHPEPPMNPPPSVCPECKGSGAVFAGNVSIGGLGFPCDRECDYCQGTGQVWP